MPAIGCPIAVIGMFGDRSGVGIGLPFNDLRCLGSITEVIAELVKNEDPILVELAEKYGTVEKLAAWIRTLPQRDDNGDPDDGPKVEACEPVQRLRIPADDPNCVERAALYIAVAELIDPAPVRQLATLDLPIGLHTFPIENGSPVVLDPRMPRKSLDCGVAMSTRRRGSPRMGPARRMFEMESPACARRATR